MQVRVLQGCKLEVWRAGRRAVFPSQVATACLFWGLEGCGLEFWRVVSLGSGGWKELCGFSGPGSYRLFGRRFRPRGCNPSGGSCGGIVGELCESSPRTPPGLSQSSPEPSQRSRRGLAEFSQSFARAGAGLAQSSRRTLRELSQNLPRVLWAVGQGIPMVFSDRSATGLRKPPK